MATNVRRVTFSLPPEVDQALDEKAAQCVESLGRRNNKGAEGGWRSELVRAALEKFDMTSFIAERQKAA